MLIPKRQVAGETAVRIDPRFNLCRTVDKCSLWKPKGHQLPIIFAITKASEPTGHLVLSGDGHWKHEHEFGFRRGRKLRGHIIRQHFDLAVAKQLTQDFPAVLP